MLSYHFRFNGRLVELNYVLQKNIDEIPADQLDKQNPFMTWWGKTCQGDWLTAYTFFRLGVALFLIDLSILGWIKFGLSAAIGIPVCSAMGFGYWNLHVTSQWENIMNYAEREEEDGVQETLSEASEGYQQHLASLQSSELVV